MHILEKAKKDWKYNLKDFALNAKKYAMNIFLK